MKNELDAISWTHNFFFKGQQKSNCVKKCGKLQKRIWKKERAAGMLGCLLLISGWIDANTVDTWILENVKRKLCCQLFQLSYSEAAMDNQVGSMSLPGGHVFLIKIEQSVAGRVSVAVNFHKPYSLFRTHLICSSFFLYC